MATALKLFRANRSIVETGNTPVVVFFAPLQGGLIVNPAYAEDQGIAVAETLFVDIVSPATDGQTSTTIPLQPGQSFTIPPGDTISVSANAATSGHRFSAVAFQNPSPFPPPPQPGPFPPSGPVTVQGTIPSYLYVQYKDDDDCQAFVRSFNEMAQSYVTFFNELNLPNPISGSLLDWVAEGLYGITRTALSSGRNRDLGPYNTFEYDLLAFNGLRIVGPSNITATSDDIFRRIITWNYSKIDGTTFNVRWLKRRVMRFLIGEDGANLDPDQTYQISVTFGLNRQVNIGILSGERIVLGGAFFNGFAFNSVAYDELISTFNQFTPLVNASIFKEAVDSGVLQLPFQFSYVVNIA